MIWTAFVVGFLGSMHCIGMCGPIAMAIPVPEGNSRYVGILLYNTGRVITYGFLGFLFGAFGSLFALAGLQQFLSILAGVCLLAMVFMLTTGKSSFFGGGVINKGLFFLKSKLSYYLKKHSMSSLLMVGLMNGLLPCGLVYVAVIGAVSTGSAFMGSYYMALFGLGTIPAMYAIAIFKNFIPNAWRYKLTKWIPLIISVIGLSLILRGLDLGIPYLSPEISSSNPKASNCCEKVKCH